MPSEFWYNKTLEKDGSDASCFKQKNKLRKDAWVRDETGTNGKKKKYL